MNEQARGAVESDAGKKGTADIEQSTFGVRPDAWASLRQYTAARIALGRTGGSVPTEALLSFNLDHALARDAVQAEFDAEELATELRAITGMPEVITLATAAGERGTYLRRPDLGRRLAEESREKLAERAGATEAKSRDGEQKDLVVIVSDGLSALAARRQAGPMLRALLPRLSAAGITVGPVCVVRHARVDLLSEVGAHFGARLALILLGERPGLGTPDSLGAYFEYDPRPGRTNAERNCISNIRPAGLPPEAAAIKLVALLAGALARRGSGIALKESGTKAGTEMLSGE